ncbi:tRNA (uracil(54)-C(5))-methyltransferase homolog-B-like [Zootermopsis nevadensis]|uniref:tRNA (uracil(54)-C(5))-methyltransferase n=1 Tax=Zootermopsis nevadensis TaxID=136037 RepID=A0A067QFL7_ZOONE|nr:tRNA (uracil(54)-C(5))-methyltransferase homolog-B-like [Zootermopsis nevadensis]XP_021941505.1 tRNA (uracil(54)-C(5))-methyltransferase homolog-B-like [Zootermopsis nevadensis]XP_021941506.1 tRNA (uracil(54)-C(5))-methyltransferase homolog-B-like [Zootermopsis nevadensis]KDR06356.1 TRNA (uracil-5-)-methyltransferase-like protein A [Zootermopsis nevadensis]
MSSKVTNETPPQQDEMEVDGDGDREELQQEPEDATMNGDEKVNGEEKGQSKSGIFKVKVSGLPRFYPLGEFKRLVKEELGLALSYIRSPKRGNPWLHLTFGTAEEQQKAMKALHKYTWRKKTLTCNILTTDAQKRKPEEGTGDDSDAKKAKLDLSVDERVLMVTIPYHNIPYEEQLKKKTEELKAMVSRLGDLVVRRNPDLAGWAEQQREKYDGLAFQLDDIRPSPVIDAYRNKCEFRIGLNPDTQERTVGCRLENYKDGSIGVGPADSLKHLPDQMREAVKLFQDYVRKSDKPPFIAEKGEGYWRHLVVRMTSSNELMVVVVAHPQFLTEDELMRLKNDLKDYFVKGAGKVCNISSLYFQQFTEKLVGVPLPQMEHLYGKTHLEEDILDLTFQLSPSSYFQVNTKGAEVLYSAIIDLVEPTEDTTVLDLCCGTGGIGLCIAKKCGQVFGVEYLEQNVEDAKINAAKNEITNCEFIAGRVEDVLSNLSEKITGKIVVPILDPPRTGLNQKVLSHLRKMDNVQKLVYVCSNHKAPIRNFLDLCCPEGKSTMTGHPFVPMRIIPVDVAPHTMHSQMVILLERVDPSKLPKAKNPVPRSASRKSTRGRTGRGMKGSNMMIRGHGSMSSRMRGGMPLAGPVPRAVRGGARGRGMGMLMGNMRAPPLMPQRMGYMGPPQIGPTVRDFSRAPVRSRTRDLYMDGYGPSPLMERGYFPPVMETYAPRRPQRFDFSSDELTLSRYSDFRRDVEDAIDSSFSPRSLGIRRPTGSFGMGDGLLMGSPAATAAAMLEREEMAYRAGLTRGLVGAAAFGPPPNLYSQYGAMTGGRLKGTNNGRGTKRGGNVGREARGRRGRGGLR